MSLRSVWRRVLPGRMIGLDLEEEIRFHVEGRIEELVDMGWDPDAAREEVLRRFGDMEAVQKACMSYDVQRVYGTTRRLTVEAWWRDVRLAIRSMRRSPGFYAIVVIT